MTAEFMAEAERRALEERRALDLTSRCRLDPVLLARSKGIKVQPLSGLEAVPAKHMHHLQHDGVKALSAAAVIDVKRNAVLIVVNDKHSKRRQANSIAHELAHVILKHPPGYIISRRPGGPSIGGFDNLTKAHEDEADWLAGCLLVPATGIASTMRACGHDIARAAAHYGVSIKLMRWRLAASQVA